MYCPNKDPAVSPFTPYVAGGGVALQNGALEGDRQTDVTVIGGGIAGSSLALHLAEAGTKVTLLEAKEIGWGASSRNAGHVAPATKQDLRDLQAIYGRVHGKRLSDLVRRGPEIVFGLAERHQMNAAVDRAGVVSAAHTAHSAEVLRDRAAFLKAADYDVSYLDRGETAELMGSDAKYYYGSLLDRHGGTINPLAYVRGLARAACRAGVDLHQYSPAVKITREGQHWLITAPKGSVTSRWVAICTNAYCGDLVPELKTSIVPVRAFQFVTEPLNAELRPSVLPGRQGVTDTRRLMSGIRIHPDGRLHFSGIGPLFGKEADPNIETSLQRIRDIFPQIGNIKVDFWWSGWMAMNPGNAWQIHKPAPGMVAALGCNGRGVALATIFGRELAEFIAGKGEGELALPFSEIKKIPAHAFHRPLVNALVTYYRARDTLDTFIARRHSR